LPPWEAPRGAVAAAQGALQAAVRLANVGSPALKVIALSLTDFGAPASTVQVQVPSWHART
jgi:hypothetical protein